MILNDEVLAGLANQGCKVECPVCGKRCFSEEYRTLRSSGIGQHIRQCHSDLEDMIFKASNRIEKSKKEKEKREKEERDKEREERPKRKFVVSGAFLDEVVDELEALIGCMEAYYIQGNCDKDARELIERIERMHEDAKTNKL